MRRQYKRYEANVCVHVRMGTCEDDKEKTLRGVAGNELVMAGNELAMAGNELIMAGNERVTLT